MQPTDKESSSTEPYSQHAPDATAAPPPLSASLTRAQAEPHTLRGTFLPIDQRQADGIPTLGTSPGTQERFSFDSDMRDRVARQNNHVRMMTIVIGCFVAVVLAIGTIAAFALTGHGSTPANHDSTAPVAAVNFTATPAALVGMTTVTVLPMPTQTAISVTPVPSTPSSHGKTPATVVPTPIPTAVLPTATVIPATGWNTVAIKYGPPVNGYGTAIILNEYYDSQECGGWCAHWQGKDVISIPSAAANTGTLTLGAFGYADAAGAGAQPPVNGQWNLQDFSYNRGDMFTGAEILTPCANMSFVFTQGTTVLFNFTLDHIYCKS